MPERHIAISEGTIYPLMKRPKDDGFFTTYLQESQEGPPRKYYQLTELGRKTKEELSLKAVLATLGLGFLIWSLSLASFLVWQVC
jgi:PadR family transcriptional regulator PadR